MRWTTFGAGALAVALGACGGDSGGGTVSVGDGGVTIQNTSGPLLPWAVGNTWTYRVTDKGTSTSKIVSVGALEAVGGAGANAAAMANKVTSVTPPDDETITWQAPLGDVHVRYRDQSLTVSPSEVTEENVWAPYRIYLDASGAHTKKGATWVVTFDETKTKAGKMPASSTQEERWTVIAEDEVVVVPAGAYRAVVLQKTGGSNVKTYWFVRGVGKVKESGGQIEELVTYELK
jgi:hypothetical protein